LSIAIAGNEISEAARRRMLSVRGEPLFICNWDRALFIHYEVDPEVLQKSIPFELDLNQGRAFVSIVAFTMCGMRPRFGGQLTTLLCKPIATHGLLNVRTYIRHNAEPGIYFMSEWLENRVSVVLGPRMFGLPYRFGRLDYRHAVDVGELRGRVEAREGMLRYRGHLAKSNFTECESGSLSEFLLERYTAFTAYRGRKRFFRVWHEPWRQLPVDIDVVDDDLLSSTGDWWESASQISANYSAGASVWMGWPHKIN
jgi:uncharacterized protein YqjF (DUF2071 family)